MKLKKIALVLLTLVVVYSSARSQNEENKTVTITVSGTGQTKDEAKEKGLRNAIEQAFGAFISSKTEILVKNC